MKLWQSVLIYFQVMNIDSNAITKRKRKKKLAWIKNWLLERNKKEHTTLYSSKAIRLRAFPQIFTYKY